MNNFENHSLAQYYKAIPPVSETLHLNMLDHWRTKLTGHWKQKTAKEKMKLKTAIANYPNKNHRP